MSCSAASVMSSHSDSDTEEAFESAVAGVVEDSKSHNDIELLPDNINLEEVMDDLKYK